MADEDTDLTAALDETLGGKDNGPEGVDPTGDLMNDFVRELASPDEPEETDEEKSEDTEDGESEDTEDSETTDEEESEDTDEEESEDTDEEESEEDAPEDPPKGASKKASEDWKKLRGSRDKYKTQATELEQAVQAKEKELTELQTKVQELEELRGKAALSEELEEKLKNYDEMEKRVAMLDVKQSKAYIDAVDTPLNAIEEQADALIKSNDADAGAVFKALNEPDLAKQRMMLKEVTAGWDEIEKVELWEMAKDARGLLVKQREMLENAHEARKQSEAQSAEQAARAAEAAKKEFSAATEGVLDNLKEKLPFVPLRDGETADDRFAAVAEKLKNVDFSASSANDKAFAAASALILPTAVKTIDKLRKEVEALEHRLEKKNATKPSSKPKEKKPEPEEEDFLESLGIPSDPLISERLVL